MRSRNVRGKKEKERKQEETEEERREREPGPGAVFVKLCGQLLLAKMWAGGLAVALTPTGTSGRASRRGARNREICKDEENRTAVQRSTTTTTTIVLSLEFALALAVARSC